jgi:hypothetical protein
MIGLVHPELALPDGGDGEVGWTGCACVPLVRAYVIHDSLLCPAAPPSIGYPSPLAAFAVGLRASMDLACLGNSSYFGTREAKQLVVETVIGNLAHVACQRGDETGGFKVMTQSRR